MLRKFFREFSTSAEVPREKLLGSLKEPWVSSWKSSCSWATIFPVFWLELRLPTHFSLQLFLLRYVMQKKKKSFLGHIESDTELSILVASESHIKLVKKFWEADSLEIVSPQFFIVSDPVKVIFIIHFNSYCLLSLSSSLGIVLLVPWPLKLKLQSLLCLP